MPKGNKLRRLFTMEKDDNIESSNLEESEQGESHHDGNNIKVFPWPPIRLGTGKEN